MIVDRVVNKYYTKIPKNLYFEGVIGFFENFPSNRNIRICFPTDEPLFFGKDARIFFKLMNEGRLPSAYRHLLEEASNGLSKVIVENVKDQQKTKIILKMLNLPLEVRIA